MTPSDPAGVVTLGFLAFHGDIAGVQALLDAGVGPRTLRPVVCKAVDREEMEAVRV